MHDRDALYSMPFSFVLWPCGLFFYQLFKRLGETSAALSRNTAILALSFSTSEATYLLNFDHTIPHF